MYGTIIATLAYIPPIFFMRSSEVDAPKYMKLMMCGQAFVIFSSRFFHSCDFRGLLTVLSEATDHKPANYLFSFDTDFFNMMYYFGMRDKGEASNSSHNIDLKLIHNLKK